MRIHWAFNLLPFIILGCSSERFLVDSDSIEDSNKSYLVQTQQTLVLDKQLTGKLSKKSPVGYFESDTSYYSPYDVSQAILSAGEFTIQLNSIVSSGFKSPFMFPLVKVFDKNNEELEVKIIQNQMKAATFHLAPHIKTFWKVTNEESQPVKIVVYADRTPIDGDYKTTTLFIDPTMPLVIPFQKKVIKVPFGKFKLKGVNFDPEHYSVRKSRL